MSGPASSYALLLGLGALVSLALGARALRAAASWASAFVVFNLGVVLWSGALALELVSAELRDKLFWGNVGYVGVALVPTSFLVVALRFSGRGAWVTSTLIALLSIEPVVLTLVAWTSPWHDLFRRSVHVAMSGALDWKRGPAFWFTLSTPTSWWAPAPSWSPAASGRGQS